MHQEVANNRHALLNESFGRFLEFGLKPDRNVSALCTVSSCLAPPPLQAFQSFFPTLPEPVLNALFDLYRQVLLHVEINSKVIQARMRLAWCAHGIS